MMAPWVVIILRSVAAVEFAAAATLWAWGACDWRLCGGSIEEQLDELREDQSRVTAFIMERALKAPESSG